MLLPDLLSMKKSYRLFEMLTCLPSHLIRFREVMVMRPVSAMRAILEWIARSLEDCKGLRCVLVIVLAMARVSTEHARVTWGGRLRIAL
jgi:hypothetical protein